MGKSPFSRVSAREHQEITKNSFFVSNGPFSFRFKKTPQKRGLAIVISSKLVPLAVERNRYRRLIRAVFMEDSVKIPKDATCIVFMKQRITTDSLAKTREFISPLIDRAFHFIK